ncbi:MAG: class I SAM-dependent methyltransferase [Nanoarchaeota archaeon]|nr:class I SAM-dependent methyltransferase [Nanoarchaeota archaeon]
MDDAKQLTQAAYDAHATILAEKYKERMDLSRRPEFKRFLELVPGNTILDAGSGAGDHARYFKEHDKDVLCIDFSPKMISLCKEKGLEARVMDIEAMSFREHAFDGIWAVDSFQNIRKRNLPKVVARMAYIIKPDGILYVVVREGDSEGVTTTEYGSKKFLALWQKEDILLLFEKQFTLLDFSRETVGDKTYLQFFFKKRPDAPTASH